MASPPSLWPENNNKDLILAVANYLQSLLTKNASSLDEVSTDSLQVATESLQTILCPDDDQLPQAPFTLEQMYASYIGSGSHDASDEKQAKASSSSSSQQSPPPDLAKRKKKFLEFLSVLEKHNFFRGCDKGTPEYKNRMEKAQAQYNDRFPHMSIDNLSWIFNDNEKPIDKTRGEQLKNEGNQLLKEKNFEQAIVKYTQAIECNPSNAVYYSNRAAAYTYLKKYKQAVSDAVEASKIDPNYIKAYVREGVAQYELGEYEKASEAYNKALKRTKTTDKNWEVYMEKVQLCQMKMDEANDDVMVNNNSNNNSNSNSNNAMPDLGSLLGGLGGAGGAGGMDFNKLLQNPAMRQMAEQLMQDPQAMQKMGNLMNQFGGMAGGMPGGMGGMPNANNNNNDNNNQDNMQQVMADLMQNPEKAQRIFQKAMKDPEMTQMVAQDPSIAGIVDRIKNGDLTAFMELGSKPQAMATVKSLVQKYYQ